ncbi:hypothetical protein C8R44DRAFT_794735 [Mycena epipterygia]|nr:hypothetical protein C8R44DRAFT_794735 [Mycena epipterygia]
MVTRRTSVLDGVPFFIYSTVGPTNYNSGSGKLPLPLASLILPHLLPAGIPIPAPEEHATSPVLPLRTLRRAFRQGCSRPGRARKARSPSITVILTLDSLVTNNPLLFELTLHSVSTQAGLNGTVFATLQHTFPNPFFLGTVIPLGILDLINVDVNIRAFTIDGISGVPLVISGLHQGSVPTTYTLDL